MPLYGEKIEKNKMEGDSMAKNIKGNYAIVSGNSEGTGKCILCGEEFTQKFAGIQVCNKCYFSWSASIEKKKEEKSNELSEECVQKSTLPNDALFNKAVEISRKTLYKSK